MFCLLSWRVAMLVAEFSQEVKKRRYSHPEIREN